MAIALPRAIPGSPRSYPNYILITRDGVTGMRCDAMLRSSFLPQENFPLKQLYPCEVFSWRRFPI